jgi:hypothetical protein
MKAVAKSEGPSKRKRKKKNLTFLGVYRFLSIHFTSKSQA